MENSKDNTDPTVQQYVQEIQDKSVDNINQLNSLPPGKGDIIITDCMKEAHRIVDTVIEKCSRNFERIEDAINLDENVPNITWLSIEEFTIDNGISKIDEFVKVLVKYFLYS